MPNEVVYVMFSHQIQQFEGEALTFLDAIITDPTQRKAAKDIMRPMIWDWAIRSNFAEIHKITNVHTGKEVSNRTKQGEISNKGPRPKSA